MTLYRKYIRPMNSFLGQNGSPRTVSIEAEVEWYPEEDREQLENKYASYNEGPFSDLVFEEKFEPYAVEPQFKKPKVPETGLSSWLGGEDLSIEIDDEFKEAIIETVKNSKAKHPVELFQELLVFLYTKGYADGQHYIDVREGYGET